MRVLLFLFLPFVCLGCVNSERQNPNDENGNSISVKINNNLGVDLFDAKLNMDNSDDWSSLGVILQGVNNYTIKADSVSSIGVIQFRFSNGQWVGGLSKSLGSKNISLEINRDLKKEVQDEWNKVAKVGTIPATITSTTPQNSTDVISLYPLDRKYKYGWYTVCNGGGAYLYMLSCDINSTPNDLTFTGISAGGAYPLIKSQGVWYSDLSRSELWGQAGRWKAWGVFYTDITMESHSRFKGGGLMLGLINGDGKISGVPPSKPPPVDPPPSQERVKIESIARPGMCLAAASNRRSVTLQSCSNIIIQRWTITSRGSLFMLYPGEPAVPPFVEGREDEVLCLTAEGTDIYKLPVTLEKCIDGSLGQEKWIWAQPELVKYDNGLKYSIGLTHSTDSSLKMFSYLNREYERYPLAAWKLVRQ